ncbi:MAG: hypothetical protein KJ862_05205 [Proteobacteria bacterium]|nr:hypothetical protein [Pseudomonadota bacterium]
MYRKKNGLVSFRLKSYLLVHTDVIFNLNAYLRNLTCQLTLSSGLVVPMDTSYTIRTQAEYVMETMAHLFWASGEAELESMCNSVGKLRLDYHISFTGHPDENPDFFETIVPLVVRTRKYKRL